MTLLKRLLCVALFAPFSQLASSTELDTLEFDSLMDSDVQLTSVMKRLQAAKETGASVYVLSSEEIERSGASSIPEVLNLVPGIEARQIDNNYWAISSRGPASLYVSKLLVLVDGQSIYNPVHAGVNWESLNIPLFDLERIEVIRGPGGQLWGSNATNGVINIITKHTEDTRNTAGQVETGTVLNYKATIRHGGALGSLGSYRVSATSKDVPESKESRYDIEPNDSSRSNTLNGRLDLNLSDDLFWLVQGNYQSQEINGNARVTDTDSYSTFDTAYRSELKNYSLMSRIEHSLSENSSQMLQVTYAYTDAQDIYYEEENSSLDVDYQMNTRVGSAQLDWGANYRLSKLKMADTDYVSMLEDETDLKQYGGFLQAQMELIPQALKVVVGNKSEYNNLTGWEHQPMARVVWSPTRESTLWASASQGVRIPSWIEYYSQLLVKGVALTDIVDSEYQALLPDELSDYRIKRVVLGSDNVKAETSFSKELGYRYHDINWSLDLSLFHTQSDRALGLTTDLSPELPASLYEYQVANDALATGLGFSDFDELLALCMVDYIQCTSYLSQVTIHSNLTTESELTTYGGEVVVKRQFGEAITAELGYSQTTYRYDHPDDVVSVVSSDSTLKKWLLKTSVELSDNQTLTLVGHYQNGEAYSVDSHYGLDLSWNWQASQMARLNLTVNNLLHGDKLEYANSSETYIIPTYVEPSFSAKLHVLF